MLSFRNVSLRRGTELLFSGANFTIHQGNRVGLVGANGSGKSSLFQMILQQLDCDNGEIELSTGVRIAHMAQEVHATDQPAIDYVLTGDSALMATMNALQHAEDTEAFEQLAALHEQMENIDGYAARSRAATLLAGLGFSESDHAKPLSAFSGGWRIRLNLAQTLMTPAELMLLDEPTNHLDLDAIIWLTDWIRQFSGTLILISHDREFLDESVNHIAHLHAGRIELYTGNYSSFEKIRAARLALQQSSFEKQQREIAHMQDFVRRFRAQATKARQAQSRLKALERMEVIAPAHVDSPFSFEILAQEKISTPLLSLQHANLGYAEPVIKEVNLSLLPGDRYGLLGANGAGKSTLVKTLNGQLPLLSGECVNGANLKTGYFSQHQLDDLIAGDSAMDHLINLGRTLGEIPREQEVRNFLGGFNFQGDKVLDPVSSFSGGQKARLALALIAWTRPNLLLMDEPTNHLDLDMRQALTVALQSFEGAIILVSHDQHLMANTVDEFLLVEDSSIKVFAGDLQDYRKRILPGSKAARKPVEDELTSSKAAPASAKPESIHRPGKQTRQLRTKLKTANTRMERLQRKIAEVEEQLADPAIYEDRDNPKLQSLLRDQHALNEEIESVENEWLELTEELENLGG